MSVIIEGEDKSQKVCLLRIRAAATAASLAGLLFSYFFDISIGPAIALFLGAFLVITALFSSFAKLTHSIRLNEITQTDRFDCK